MLLEGGTCSNHNLTFQTLQRLIITYGKVLIDMPLPVFNKQLKLYFLSKAFLDHLTPNQEPVGSRIDLGFVYYSSLSKSGSVIHGTNLILNKVVPCCGELYSA